MLTTAAISITVREMSTGATKRIAARDLPFDPMGLLRSERTIPWGTPGKLIGTRAYRPIEADTERGITARRASESHIDGAGYAAWPVAASGTASCTGSVISVDFT